MADYKIVGTDFYNYRGQKLAIIKGADIFDTHSRKIGTVRDNEVYDDRYNKIVMVRGEDIFDIHNVRIASLLEIKRNITNPPGNTIIAALWWFFIKEGN